MILGINPTVDYAFKHLLGRESTRPILIDVLESVLQPAPGRHIRDLELLNPFNPKEALDDKLSILDIKARDQAGGSSMWKCKCWRIAITKSGFFITAPGCISNSFTKARITWN